MTQVSAIVLAAGRSARYRHAGGVEETKLVAALDGKAIVRRVVEAALASRARPVLVVVGHARQAVEAAVAGLPAVVVVNPDYRDGIASSLRAGLSAAPRKIDGALVLLGDMPRVETRLINAMIEAFRRRPNARAVAPVRDGRRGNPVLLSRAMFEEAMQLDGDEGARRLIARLDAGDVTEVAADSDVAFDIDTPEDLERTRRQSRHPSSPSD